MRGSFISFIVLVVAVAVIAAIRGDWLIAAAFAVMALAGARLQSIANQRRKS